MDKHIKYMGEALKEAQKAFSKGEVPVGAVIVCNDRVIARGHNLTESLNDSTAHAEMQAITAASSYLGGKYLKECVIYVTLEPCCMCAGALFWSQISTVVYGASDPKRGYSLVSPSLLHPKTIVLKNVLPDDTSKLMLKFFEQKR